MLIDLDLLKGYNMRYILQRFDGNWGLYYQYRFYICYRKGTHYYNSSSFTGSGGSTDSFKVVKRLNS
jgi:hypothetical protein